MGDGFDLGGHISRIYGRRNEGIIVPRVEVTLTEGQLLHHHCHINVNLWLKENPSHVGVSGWVLFDFGGYFNFVRFCHHSVVQREDGTLIDITPTHAMDHYPFIIDPLPREQFLSLVEANQIVNIDLRVR